MQVAAIVQTLNEIDDDDDEEEDKEKIDLPPEKLVWMGCAVSGLMAVFTAALALCSVNEATKSRSLCLSVCLSNHLIVTILMICNFNLFQDGHAIH